MGVVSKSKVAERSAQSSAERVADELSRAVVAHRVMPGAKLGEDELAEIFQVSRTVVRSALQQLAHSKLVVIERNRGAFVAKPDPAEARDIMEARSLLEPRTARSAAERMTPPALKSLKDRLVEEHAALDKGDM